MDIDSDAISQIKNLVTQGLVTKSDNFGNQFVIVPEGMKLEHIENEEWVKPDGINQEVKFTHPDSFISYVNEYKNEHTKVFADTAHWRLHVAVDYHGKDSPELVRHHGYLQMERTPEYMTWFNINKESIDQEEFAEFIEENQKDIHSPDSATILEIATNLKVKKDVNFSSAMTLQNGAAQFQYSENIETQTQRGSMEIPTEIVLGIPVFEGQDSGYKIPAFFRYRMRERRLKFRIDIQNLARMQRKAFEDVVSEIQEKIGIEILFGSCSK